MKLRAVALVLAVVATTGLTIPVASAAAAPVSAATPGYVIVNRAGAVFAFGGDRYEGSLPSRGIATDAVVGVQVLENGKGYWIVTAVGEVYAFGAAKFYGSLRSSVTGLVVGIVATPDDLGYWLFDNQGNVYAFGDARFEGNLGISGVNVHDIVAMASTADGKGYYLAGANGMTYSIGDTSFHDQFKAPFGSPVSSIALDGVTGGFWLASAKGGIFAFHAHYYGATSGSPSTIVGIAPSSDSAGYWLVNSQGKVFGHGDATWLGSAPPTTIPVVAIG